ncbi:hypothetical protein MCI89_01510 [Muricomes sp. OA1]|uniref:hypothetical protein n=1 Tax=Muricomes sp. OA1 TaxID=2914165 RepID=UPI001F050673|nr:hypothetical protein [Muricomes sp. OA1]MCH1971024.1 hypothetical protein [Muricomes sp. OA1]
MTDKAKRNTLRKHKSAVCCPGCGEEINGDSDLTKVEYVRTKRGTDVFFHTGCMDKVWK